jgi:hypothetical protein
MYVVDHKECRNGTLFDGVGVHRSSAAQAGSIFDVKTFFRKTDGSGISVYRFQIHGGECGKHIFRTVCAVSVICNDQRPLIGDGVNGIFQEIALSEKRSIKGYSSDNHEE